MTPLNKQILPMQVTEVAELISELAVLAYFPTEVEARRALARELVSICPNISEARWLITRFCELFNRWPGPRELRAVYCSRNKPRDGFEISSTEFPDGVPTPVPGSELAWYPAIEAAPVLQLPPGHLVSGDITLENDIRRLAAEKDMNRLKAVELRNPEYKPITEADIEAALEENRDRHAREELLP